MDSIGLILTAILTLSLSGLPGCLLPARSPAGQRLAMLLLVLGSAVGLVGVGLALHTPGIDVLVLPWHLPWGQFAVRVDTLSAVFLLVVFTVPALGAIYGLGYWPQAEHADNGRGLSAAYGLLAGGMALVCMAADGVLFLIAWEVMALAAYFAATTEEDLPEVRRAGWVYLVATHLGTLCLLALFALWHQTTGDFALTPTAMATATANAIFVLAVIGFGAKAGFMPLHVWLPGAHANAPSHVSAVMSGVMLKMGIYGLLRVTSILPMSGAWWGGLLLTVGAVSGVAGIAFAIGQRDLKRLLAYSSIENIGIITMGLGLALLGRWYERPEWVLLGLGGALLHTWNHALFKSLLFFAAGALIHATQTREIDQLGGLAKRLPRLFVLFVIGAVAICALPPLNGFASEWLLYLGLFHTLGTDGGAGLPVAATAAVALAMIGALAVACFVKLLGAIFLGTPRSAAGAHAHEPPPSMFAPMVMLATGCVALGLLPVLALPLLSSAAGNWVEPVTTPNALAWSRAPLPPLDTLASLWWLTALSAVLLLLILLLVLLRRLLPRAQDTASAGTWDCGYARGSARIQYTGSSFGHTLVELFGFVLWPQQERPALRALFARAASYKSLVPDPVLDRLVVPVFERVGRWLPRLRLLQQGQTHLYVLYLLIVVIVLLLWGGPGVSHE